MGCVNSTPQKGSEPHNERKVEVENGHSNDGASQPSGSTEAPANNAAAPKDKGQLEDDPYIIDYVLKKWKLADKDNSGRLSFHEIKKLLDSLNITMKEHVVKEKFKKFDKDNSGELDFNEFRNFLEDLRVRPELKELFNQYSKNKPFMTPEEFLLFLQQEQYELNTDVAHATKLIKEATHSEAASKLFYNGFAEYITSAENSAYNAAHRSAIYQDMTQPLSHYYIASSHNTYLEGDQLKSNSSVAAYINVLKAGCRLLELDCWDGEDGTPSIFHGHTMTSKIKFRDVIQAVKDYGFVASPYPVILSFEQHCSLEQQVVMAQILKDILGDMLPRQFILDQTRPLPSPEQLRNKVLVKGKMLSASQNVTSSSEDDDEDDDDEAEDDGSTTDADDDDMTPNVRKEKSEKKEKEELKKSSGSTKPPKPPKVTTAKEMSDLVHLKSVKFSGYQQAKDKNAPWEMSSFSELKVKKLVKADLAGAIELNMNQLTKVYPKGTRFDSSNFMPMVSWCGGYHIVALNYQTKDVPMRLNLGKFYDNGGCGYVLKPAPLRSLTVKPENVKKILHIRLVSAWQLPKESGTPKGEVIDPYVKIKMYGLPEDTKRYKSKVIQNNGFNPQWDEKVAFDLTRSDLAEVLFEIYDQDKLSKDDFIGFAAIPISSIKPGYRSVHLYDKQANPLPEASLFVQFNFE